MTLTRLTLSTAAATVMLLAGSALPAQAFHHVVLPANSCGPSAHAGGANPVGRRGVAGAQHRADPAAPARRDPSGRAPPRPVRRVSSPSGALR